LSPLPRNSPLTGMPWTRWPGSRAGCLMARSATAPTHPSSRLNSWGSWHLLPMFPFPSPYLFGVGLHKASRPATFFPVSPLFDPGRRPGLKGRDALRPDALRRLRRAGAVKDGCRPPRSGARKACVLDGSEHRGTSLAVYGGLCGFQPVLRHRSARSACHLASSCAHRAVWMALSRCSSASVTSGNPLRIN